MHLPQVDLHKPQQLVVAARELSARVVLSQFEEGAKSYTGRRSASFMISCRCENQRRRGYCCVPAMLLLLFWVKNDILYFHKIRITIAARARLGRRPAIELAAPLHLIIEPARRRRRRAGAPAASRLFVLRNER